MANSTSEIVEARANGLLTEREARDALRTIRPEWFPTNPNMEAQTRYKAVESSGFVNVVPADQLDIHPYTVSVYRSVAKNADEIVRAVLDHLNGEA